MTGMFALLAAALGLGMFSGALLAAIYTHAKVSLAQERMQRIVRYWQAEARRWRAEVEFGPQQWPDVANPPIDPWGN
jgi:hypothetical protein